MSADVIVIGGGHNSLTCAAALAKRGKKVLVLEKRATLGGLCESWEFHSGFRSAGVLQDTTAVRASIVDSLNLTHHGLKRDSTRPGVLALGEPGQSLWIPGALDEAVKALGDSGEAYKKYRGFLSRLSPVLDAFLNKQPIDLVEIESVSVFELLGRALGIRRLGRKDMMELLRTAPSPVADTLREFFNNELLAAALALPALAGTRAGPRAPGTATNLLMYEAAAGGAIAGGGQALVSALKKSALAFGAEIRTDAEVHRIIVNDGKAVGVSLVGGEELLAPTVVSGIDPKTTLLKLLPPLTLGFGAQQNIENIRSRGTTAQVLLAVEGEVRFTGRSEATEFARLAANLDHIEKAHDATKYGEVAAEPALEIHVPSVSAPELAPTGSSVVSALVHFVSHDLEGGWNDAAKDALADKVVSQISAHCDGLSVVGRAVLAPDDIESRYGLSGGHVHHAEHALDQLLIRPVRECVGYKTPIPGLHSCGAGSHPGGGISCAPGGLAAQAILR